MKQDDVIQPDVFSGLLNDAIGMNIQTLELFAGMYLCEKLRQDLAEKAADILGTEVANGCKSLLRVKDPDEYDRASSASLAIKKAASEEEQEPTAEPETLSAKLQRRAKA